MLPTAMNISRNLIIFVVLSLACVRVLGLHAHVCLVPGHAGACTEASVMHGAHIGTQDHVHEGVSPHDQHSDIEVFATATEPTKKSGAMLLAVLVLWVWILIQPRAVRHLGRVPDTGPSGTSHRYTFPLLRAPPA